jgi:RNA-directed DNA polymerase
MKTYDNLYCEICSFKNLLLASKKARKGKRSILYVQKFEIELENELHQLKKELTEKTYKPGKYKEFYIYEPKKRMISAAPYRDRIVHHALCNIIEPIFEKSFIEDSYANRKGKGTHAALDKYGSFSKENRYVLKCDVKKYFPSIDHEILKQIVREKIICKDTLELIDKIIDNSNPQEEINTYFNGDNLFTPFERKRGIPIGNLTSQFLANVFLDRLDDFVNVKLGINKYIRYVDDFVIFGNDKKELMLYLQKIDDYLENLRLILNKNKTKIHHTKQGVKFLGFKLFHKFRLVQRSNVIRAKTRFKKIELQIKAGIIEKPKVLSSVNGWLGHVINANSLKLVNKMSNLYPVTFSYLK